MTPTPVSDDCRAPPVQPGHRDRCHPRGAGARDGVEVGAGVRRPPTLGAVSDGRAPGGPGQAPFRPVSRESSSYLGRAAPAPIYHRACRGYAAARQVPVLPRARHLLSGGLRAVFSDGSGEVAVEHELRYFSDDLMKVLDAEIPEQQSAARAGDRARRRRPRGARLGKAPANVAYTSYMHSLAMRGGPMEIMASLLPCSWSYVEIAVALRERTEVAHPVYGGWIAYFTLPENVSLVDDMRRDFDALVLEDATSDARRREVAQIFATEFQAGALLLGDGLHARAMARSPRVLNGETTP